MAANEAITQWIAELKTGDSHAAELLWHRYFQQIVNLARKRLDGARRAAADEEDVALSVFKSFYMGAQKGKFPALTDRDSLWSLLVAITAHKSVDLIRRENRQKRGGTGKPTADTDRAPTQSPVVPLSEIMQTEPTPEHVVQLQEQLELLLSKLKTADDPDLIRIALAKMTGSSTSEVAQQLGCVRRTVERKLSVIRSIWERECE